ncbi:MAG: nucleotide exchange factor GrpE [Anaerolineales bacterium]
MDDKERKNEFEIEGEEARTLIEQPESAHAAGKSEVNSLEDKLAEVEAKAAENLEGWQRAQAEFANYKKRLAREQELQAAEIRGRVIKQYLDIVDDLERALRSHPQDGEGAAWAEGIEIIYNKLQGTLGNEGLTRIDPLGQPFDPNLHEAVAQEESKDHASGVIIEVLRPGYLLAERVLRPAAVKVAK